MIEKLRESTGKVVGYKMMHKLHDEDYKTFVPEVEEIIDEHGSVRILAAFEDFQGWDLHALWDDIKFGAKHYSDVERIALVGEKKWEAWMAKICRPFTQAQVRYFDVSAIDVAWQWLREEPNRENAH